MTAAVVIGFVLVPVLGVLLCVAPLLSRPTLQFGIRVPPAHTDSPVIRRQRRGFQWRSAVIVIVATAVVLIIGDHASWWAGRLVLIVEFLADFACFSWARRRIAAAKSAEGWYTGVRQTVVTDTSWRSEPERFPLAWLAPAVLVILATVVIGVLRYPHLPAQLDSTGRLVATSPARAFAVVLGQLYLTGLSTGLLTLAFRARPDLDNADPSASLRAYRGALRAFTRAALALIAGADLTLLLSALLLWQVIHLPVASALIVLAPIIVGLIAFALTLWRAGRERLRVAGPTRPSDAAGRDDDRFWKGGIFYVNRDDPAIMVSARFGWGFAANFGNPTARLILAGMVAVPVGLVIIKYATGI